MRIIRGLHNLVPRPRGTVVTIGNFDGVHLGHKAVFGRLLAQGRALRLPAMVITFEPQAMEYFAPDAAPARLTRLREKLAALADCGVEQAMLLRFGPKLARMEAREFVRELLVDGLGARYLLVGDDFRFGHGRAGDFRLLREMGREHGFSVEDLHTITHGDERVSSTRIREALARGDFEFTRRLLGRTYRICGRVVHGDKRGRDIGFPTANLNLHRRVSPLRGVYAVMVGGIADRPWPGVANLGTRPTVDGSARYLLEVHLFDFTGNLYGRHLEVEFRRKLRDEKKFGSCEELQAQIGRDTVTARALLGAPTTAFAYSP
ncbi:bifunctional riboflavin kinase/FAD synthetase [Candidatus Thiosymbion oneisti]|uniref:bifunctional riboflavin kinase/FAD synthetase n=1 Tax=Candidatus Thiosymbion oneisti TaxID=589554 RepID=UPI000B7F50BE|nr:bifunctional riboflavin kinase/FAD synthetase [Candidatus Thiosymbion oneisti]